MTVVALGQHIEQNLRACPTYWAFKKRLLTELYERKAASSANPDPPTTQSLAESIFNKPGGVGQLIQNHVQLKYASAAAPQQPQPADRHHEYGAEANHTGRRRQSSRPRQSRMDEKMVEAFKAAQTSLDAKVARQLRRIGLDWGVPLARRRSKHDAAIYLKSELSHDPDEVPTSTSNGLPSRGVRDPDRVCLLDDQDVFKALMGVKVHGDEDEDDEVVNTGFRTFWTDLPFNLLPRPVMLEELRYRFPELDPLLERTGPDGVDDRDADAFIRSRITPGETVLQEANLDRAREFAKQGIPHCLRPRMWNLLVQSELVDDFEGYTKNHCRTLLTSLADEDLIIDRLIRIDARQCRNDDTYFVFEDVLRDIMLRWGRDAWVAEQISHNRDGGGETEDGEDGCGTLALTTTPYTPPNGVLPFWGISCYAMPLCFLHADGDSAYMTFRELYVRVFRHLQTIKPTPTPMGTPTLPTLLTLFESLLKQCLPILFHHLSHTLRIPPTSYAFRWIMFAFVGVLDVEQVLNLWDRVLGYERGKGEGLELFAVAAVAVFWERRGVLMGARGARDVELAFDNVSGIKIIPLVQSLIFPPPSEY
ncbi:uncharacterized protein EV422DRAFT_291043 [Fimicolochytrium jonesii]|uniref:uncharacterized protein n=1 Tax=Fimicolochytrium jonesii TaxID=1396493 RepID=UPI0022FE46BF|nr:uncharacterized protein EV422DRAFT_291043 [Fimicolochytrium jonesii]KAI8816395.1 hypothetical protein EV422DRAFT_291043 [Fimicolochytrium jonesii]